MKVVILGSGLLGVTTAYALAARGHDVEVIERQDKSAAETSFANGGQLSYSHAEPWANPGMLPKLPGWLINPASPLIFRPRADPDMIRWGLKFLRNCSHTRADAHCLTMLRLGLYSREKMRELVRETGIAFDYAEKGIIHIFSRQKDLDAAAAHAEFQGRHGCEEKMLSREEIVRLEPALAHTDRNITGGIFSPLDASGDARLFCEQLAQYAQEKFGARFRYGIPLDRIDVSGGRVEGVMTGAGRIHGDAYVVALGSYSPLFLKPLGIRLPIYPMKGYSITIPANEHTPSVSITDGSHKIVLSRLGDRLRVAGTAEFAGYDTRIREARITPIVNAAKSLLPKAAWNEGIVPWACLRPSTPDGPPILGETPLSNLYLNTGHGTLGWTQAAGSAQIVADIMEKRSPAIGMDGLTMERL